MNKYEFPKGDFLSGFSENDQEPCEYELECQRMVIRGVEYLDQNQHIFEKISGGGVGVYDTALEPMISYMLEPESGQSGAMVGHSVKHSYYAKKIGWDKYIEFLKSKDEQV